MKIIQVSASYKPAYIYGGPTMSVSKLCEELIKTADVEVLTTTANGKAELDVEPGQLQLIDGVRVTYFRRLTKDHSHFSPELFKTLYKKLRKNSKLAKDEPGSIHQITVHIHAWWNLVSVLSCSIAALFGCSVILSPRGTLSNYSFNNRSSLAKKLFHFLFGSFLLNKCHFHVTSLLEKEAVQLLCRPKSTTLIPNFVRLPEMYVKDEKKDTACLELIFMSRIEEKKGLDILFEALSQVRFPFYLTIAGTGDEVYIEKLKSIAVTFKIADKLNWIGHQNNVAKFQILEENDLLVLPSHDENFANVIVESLAAGCAVLISKNIGLSDYVEKNNFGWISENTPDNFAVRLEEINKQKPLLKEIRKNAPHKVREDFADATLIKHYLDMYKKVASSKQK